MSLILHLSFEESGASSTPSAEVTARYARMLGALLPPGRLWRLVADSVLSKLLAGCAVELARVEERADDLLDEADPSTATELLPEYESELDIEAVSTIEERRARIVGRHVARQRFRVADIQAALAPLLGQADPSDVVVLERTHAIAVTMGDDREIYVFFVYRNPLVAGTYYLDSAQALLDEIAPSHTKGYVIESIDALYDDPYTLYDRDVFGA